MTIKVLIVCDFPLLCEGLQALFQQETDLKVVAVAATGKEVREKIQECLPDVVLMDIELKNGGALEVAGWVRKKYPQIKVVTWSFQIYPEAVFTILQTGASGLLINDFHFLEVVKAIRQVTTNQVYLNPTAMKIFVERFQKIPEGIPLAHPKLTARELEVLKLLVRGNKNAQIAEHLKISSKTVATHRMNLMQKLGFRTVIELAQYAIQVGLTS